MSIYTHIYNDQLILKNINEFKNNIIICIFGVFNVSMMDNNPPPVPYINLNKYKTYLQKNEVVNINELKTNLDNIKEKLIYYNNPMYSVVIQQIDDYLYYIEKKNKKEDEKEDKNIIINCKEILKYIVQLIDNLNSASVIGTLEYIDRVMKLNNTNILCSDENYNVEK
jgi:hypothetical protein